MVALEVLVRCLTFVFSLAAVVLFAQAPPLRAQPPVHSGVPPQPIAGGSSAQRNAGGAAPNHSGNHLRATLEMATFLAGGTAWYWLDRETNAADWDYSNFADRLTLDVFRYDNNTFPVNFIYHPMAGSAYYGFARANRLSVGWAAAYAFLTSLAWEVLLEFRERISINDVLVTPGGGIPIGELWYQLSRYAVDSGSDLACWTLGLPLAVHRLLDGADACGNGSSRAKPWSQWRLAYGLASRTSNAGSSWLVHQAQFEGAVAPAPGTFEKGNRQQWFARVHWVELQAAALGARGGSGFELDSEVMLAGYMEQQWASSLDARYLWWVAAGVAFAYRSVELADWRDEWSLLSVPSLGAEARWKLGSGMVRVGARAGPVLGGAYSPLFPEWRQNNPAEQPKSVLRKQGYYYGWGGAARVYASAGDPWLRLSFSGRMALIDSDEGLDRSQANVTADIKASDVSAQYKFGASSSFGGSRWSVAGWFRERVRLSRLQGVSRLQRRWRELGFSAGLQW